MGRCISKLTIKNTSQDPYAGKLPVESQKTVVDSNGRKWKEITYVKEYTGAERRKVGAIALIATIGTFFIGLFSKQIRNLWKNAIYKNEIFVVKEKLPKTPAHSTDSTARRQIQNNNGDENSWVQEGQTFEQLSDEEIPEPPKRYDMNYNKVTLKPKDELPEEEIVVTPSVIQVEEKTPEDQTEKFPEESIPNIESTFPEPTAQIQKETKLLSQDQTKEELPEEHAPEDRFPKTKNELETKPSQEPIVETEQPSDEILISRTETAESAEEQKILEDYGNMVDALGGKEQFLKLPVLEWDLWKGGLLSAESMLPIMRGYKDDGEPFIFVTLAKAVGGKILAPQVVFFQKNSENIWNAPKQTYDFVLATAQDATPSVLKGFEKVLLDRIRRLVTYKPIGSYKNFTWNNDYEKIRPDDSLLKGQELEDYIALNIPFYERDPIEGTEYVLWNTQVLTKQNIQKIRSENLKLNTKLPERGSKGEEKLGSHPFRKK